MVRKFIELIRFIMLMRFLQCCPPMKFSSRNKPNKRHQPNTPTVGVLAFHGDFAEHIAVLRVIGVKSREVRTVEDLRECTHCLIPGGESTVMARFLWESGLAKHIQKRVRKGSLAIYGTCAGAILLAKRVTGKNAPGTLALLDFTVARNAYGTQLQSFAALLTISGFPLKLPVSFIRAPIITRVGRGVEILALHGKYPVLVRKGRVLAGTFHPEVRGEAAIHKMFLSL